MFLKAILGKTIEYYDTSIISIILSLVTIPPLWYISGGNLSWVISCTVLWALGAFAVFHPTIRYIYPWMLTKLGTIALTFILAIISIWLNATLIISLLAIEDMEIIMNRVIYSTSIGSILLFIWFYIITAKTILSNIELRLATIIEKQREFMTSLSSTHLLSYDLLKHLIEVLLVFILPIAVLFWTDITYSFRVLLGIISIGVGVGLFIHRLTMETQGQKVLISTISLLVVLVINSSLVTLFGIDNIPAREIKTSIHSDKYSIDFQFSNNQLNSETAVYHIVASIPQIGLHLGHKVASIPNKEITIETTASQYTVFDEYNHKRLLILDREELQ